MARNPVGGAGFRGNSSRCFNIFSGIRFRASRPTLITNCIPGIMPSSTRTHDEKHSSPQRSSGRWSSMSPGSSRGFPLNGKASVMCRAVQKPLKEPLQTIQAPPGRTTALKDAPVVQSCQKGRRIGPAENLSEQGTKPLYAVEGIEEFEILGPSYHLHGWTIAQEKKLPVSAAQAGQKLNSPARHGDHLEQLARFLPGRKQGPPGEVAASRLDSECAVSVEECILVVHTQKMHLSPENRGRKRYVGPGHQYMRILGTAYLFLPSKFR